ncbi:hypothetical protein BFJ68_g5350 [Fusarium oxysporum]|uniref:Apple domain-containing protein n=1 Tax=Fusarium oxysporum TaxID=5507 RepID=A0A420RGE4_FUSOX|nr:hypothetical protein BFJ68_g5350 [Fusarium oxysporum]
MARHFVRSFVIAAALSPFVNAGPCRPSSSSVAVVTTTAETSVATGSATTHTKDSSLTEPLSGTSTESSLIVSESGSTTGASTETSLTVSESESATESASATSTETTLATSKTESGSTSAEQSTTSGSALPTDITTTASESDSSTGTTLGTTTSTECTEPEPPVYNDPFTATYTEEIPATTTEAATTTEDAAATIVPRDFVRRGHPEIFVRDATSEAAPTTSEDATTTEEASTSGDTTTTGETTATSEDTTATTEGATTTTEEATTTASETATGCINNMEKPTPEGANCGARGYVWSGSNDWRYLGEGPSSSVLDCYAACQQKSNCVTFLYEKDIQCSLYMGTVTQLSPDRTGVKTYETRCFCDTGIEPAPTCSYDTSIINGGFDDGKFSPWQEDPNPGGKDPVALRPVPGGEGGTSYRLQTGQFDFDKSMWIYQDVKACPGTTFYCSYRWWWDEYYSIPQNSGGSLVPYVRVYQDDDRIGNRYPTSAEQTKTWISANFEFTMPDSGETRIWFVASSPQGEWINNSEDPCTPDWVHRPNSFALDSVYCRS